MESIGYYESVVGLLEIKTEDYKLVSIALTDKKENCVSDNYTKKVITQLDEYFQGKRQIFDLDYQFIGTPFQKQVWNELLKIPYGEVRSYKQIAEAIDCPKGYRAVGLANNKNPIMIICPCHRVIGSNNKLVGYAGGVHIKQYLLELEERVKVNK